MQDQDWLKRAYDFIGQHRWVPVMFLTCCLVVYFALRLWWENRRYQRFKKEFREKYPGSLLEPSGGFMAFSNTTRTFDATPDFPQPFGRNMFWCAVKSPDTEAVFQTLNRLHTGISHKTSANWNTGLQAVFNDFYYFATPPVSGWTLVVSTQWKDITTPDIQRLLTEWSAEFGEAQFFGHFNGAGYGALGLFRNGQCLRALSIADGDVGMDTGNFTEAEKTIINKTYLEEKSDPEMLQYYASLNNAPIFSKIEHILEIAGAWSVNPADFPQNQPSGTGLVFSWG